MSVIIPYEDDLFGNVGAFISPEGKIYHVKDDHEKFTKEYLKSIKEKRSNDIYATKIWNLYLLWENYYKDFSKNSLSDFMVLVLGFDKVETLSKNTISTSARQPHIRFYNYYLMDWKIMLYEKLHYNESNHTFDELLPYPVGLDHEDTDSYYEIEDIKNKNSILERKLFLK